MDSSFYANKLCTICRTQFLPNLIWSIFQRLIVAFQAMHDNFQYFMRRCALFLSVCWTNRRYGSANYPLSIEWAAFATSEWAENAKIDNK